MSDMGEYWRDVKPAMQERSKERRKHNRDNSAALLLERGVEFETRNDGVHLIVKGRDCLIDFWPGTGKYITRNGKQGRGVHSLLRLCP